MSLRPAQRLRWVMDIGRELVARRDRAAHVLCRDSGKALSEAYTEVDGTIRYFEYYGSLADKLEGTSIPLGDGYVDYTVGRTASRRTSSPGTTRPRWSAAASPPPWPPATRSSSRRRSSIRSDRALWTAHRLIAGQVFVNEWYAGGVETPLGGVRRSGFGREKGQGALRNYVQTKNIDVQVHDPHTMTRLRAAGSAFNGCQ